MHAKTLAVAALLATASLAGCLDSSIADPARVREIRMWVEQMEWEIHPGVTETVWAFCAEGDGVEPVHNGSNCGVPGPTIRVNEGDRIRLTFENTHNIPHTVHFHGWHPFSADMNGVEIVDGAMVTQPGHTQTIEWTAKPAGTFIYHCHFQTPTHMEKGMYGAFIVEDPYEEARGDQPDVEPVMVLDEWQVGDRTNFSGAMPDYDYFTINGKSAPLTQPVVAEPGDHVRMHLVNAGFKFRAMHLHGYTPDSWEGVAGPEHAVPTDVRRVAPGQSVVLDFTADRQGVWLFHDHVVPHATAAADGSGFGAYPRGMLTLFVVGEDYVQAVEGVAPRLLEAAEDDAQAGGHDHGDHTADDASAGENVTVVDMADFAFEPKEIHVEAGTTVKWVNRDSTYHTVTADDGSFDSGEIAAGESWTYTFEEPGTYPYHCVPHAYEDDGTWKGMVGTVVVEEPS